MVVPKKIKTQRRSLLPQLGNMRISKSEAGRRPEKAQLDARRKEEYLEHDRYGVEDERTKKGWPAFRSELWKVEKNLQTNIVEYVQERISKFSEKTPFKVMDLGCGAGVALKELKGRHRKKIKTTGVVLRKTSGETYGGVDRLIEGDINQINPREKYDLIFSNAGATFYTRLKTTAFERVISWLKPDGRAILEMGHMSEDTLNELKTLLMQNGIKNYELRKDTAVGGIILDFIKPVPKLPK
ncbi:MAG: class I SAM-dependent methyltransferase [Candidatus Diapherotrites archaeon]